MKEFSIKDLARIIKARYETRPEHTCPEHSRGSRRIRDTRYDFFTGVSIDSRTTQSGDCFFAIAGENFDGADFLDDAFAKGASCAVIGKSQIANRKSKILRVDDTIKALGDFARQYRRRMNFKVVAITGSVGKTMTRQIAYHILSRHFRVYAAPGNFNNNIGLPLTLLGADLEHEIVIAELGSSCPGEIAYLTRIALPDVAVITNVYPAHLAGFGDLPTVIKEKLSISEGLQPDGILIINADLVKWLNNYQSPVTNYQITTFGKSKRSDIQARSITHTGSGSRFTIDGLQPSGNHVQVALPLPGAGNIENALAAASICSRLGLTLDDFAQAAKTLPAVPMRAELLKIGTLTVLNDCYNANPASMKNALDILADISLTRKHRSVFICADMAELGRQSRHLHAELGDYIAQTGVKLLLAVGKFARIAADAAKKSAEYGLGSRKAGHLHIKCFEDTASACNNLEKFIKDYDIVLVKGSRVAKLEMAVEKLKELSNCDCRMTIENRKSQTCPEQSRGIENRK